MSEDRTINTAFFNALVQEDDLGCVIRGHLHIEHLVDKLLAHHFDRPEALRRIHLDYAHKIVLLEALGYLPNMTKPLAAIGGLRNDFAHKLNYEMTMDRVDGLYNSFDSEGKQVIQESYQRTRKQSKDKAPRKMAQLNPKSRFALYAGSIRAMLELAYKQQTGRYPD